ncbi:MAG: BMP family ABC transporter substrate-binding protein [Erysipelotrichaceae bacterium]|uniref:BMP family ABC transporter substrate-binding protein n=1 Tax=Floccifex porci TaxID=2606629 RepID=A0A7X2N4R0_9FIRM|nr:BMP family ABC transporter substrate-binding protein [Floccifex porci]MDO4479884.1 BMP family ABC transporter substrate-binding protein [Erysipelotrichaceae bacterium]MSS02411.1 BMP family ABC transporter substrate-binding protein [Floccifex porci]
MKKILKLFVAFSMFFGLAACGSGDKKDDTSEIRVAMITDSGDITDQSFNQTTYEAGKAFCEEHDIDFNYYKPSSDDDAARIDMVDKAVDDGYNVILMPGFLFAEAAAYGTNTYPDVKFIALDLSEFDLSEASQEANMDALYSTVYQEEIPGFMAGYAAVKMGYTELGFLGGMAVPAVIRYGYGYVQGADAAAKEMNVNINIKYVYGGQFYGDADITAKMDTWYSQGTQVVFACGGGIYTSAAEAANKVGGKLIGVDSDQAPIIDGTYAEGMTITSAMKGLANTVTTLLQAVVDGNFSDYAGKVDNLGLISEDPSENYVGLSDSTQWSDSFSEDDYKELTKKIYNKDIKISNDTEKEPSVSSNTTVDYQGSIK